MYKGTKRKRGGGGGGEEEEEYKNWLDRKFTDGMHSSQRIYAFKEESLP